jgi:hypothetical protein
MYKKKKIRLKYKCSDRDILRTMYTRQYDLFKIGNLWTNYPSSGLFKVYYHLLNSIDKFQSVERTTK